MNLTRVPFNQFVAKPWKNGLGTTYDIELLPKGSDHSNFDLRFALSPITEENVFSAFPDIERVITPIEGEGLHLGFDHAEHNLSSYQSLRFDSAQTPLGKPIQGPIKVINVMARRKSWNFLSCGVTEQDDYQVHIGQLLFLFALESCTVQSGDTEVLMSKYDALLVTGICNVSISSPLTKVLSAHFQPA